MDPTASLGFPPDLSDATADAQVGASPRARRNPVDHYAPLFQEWWDELTDPANAHRYPDRTAALAQLRRVGTIDLGTGSIPDEAQALTVSAYQRLYRRVRAWEPRELLPTAWETALVIAAVTLAHVRTDCPGRRTAALLGGPDEATRVMAQSRFLRLMRVENAGDLMAQARRVTALLGRTAPVGELGASLLFWQARPHVRRDWARSYYGLDLAERGTAAGDPPAA